MLFIDFVPKCFRFRYIYNNMFLENVYNFTGSIGLGQGSVDPGRSSAYDCYYYLIIVQPAGETGADNVELFLSISR